MSAVTRETPAWQTTPEAWKSARGIHTPWIAEISPHQLASLPASQRRAYDAKRRREWDASAEGYAAWLAEVMAAYDAGAFDPRDLRIPRAVSEAVGIERVRRAAAAEKQAAEAARAAVLADHWTRETVKVGDAVWHFIYRWMRVRRVNRETVTLAPLDGGTFAPKVAWRDALRCNPNDPTERP